MTPEQLIEAIYNENSVFKIYSDYEDIDDITSFNVLKDLHYVLARDGDGLLIFWLVLNSELGINRISKDLMLRYIRDQQIFPLDLEKAIKCTQEQIKLSII